ncbi:hypothetical protein M407DRAFT_221314 [Tulasnella calospora MUT 4182]|uniref:Uncharacterized protein n=1 Tax=Tulasnella calospora MUT 4182 TaxID=1051891 RepID=A0A0C3LF62_9AGAM|nr:hypothetical protein M407DRAFT_221314 [Tulasnella calospora MUT 4182]
MSKSSAESQSQNHVYITTRYNFAHGAIVMKTNSSDLKPHPDFKKAVMDALAITDEKKRTREIQRVLEWWGIMKCGPAEVKANAGGGTDNKQSNNQDDEFESLSLDTVGGAIEASSMVKWRESLSESRNWGITRVLGVDSAISLFNEETQLKIGLAEPRRKTPSYHRGGSLQISRRGWPLGDLGQIGTVLTAPLDGHGAIPLYHVYNGKRHRFIYGTAKEEPTIPPKYGYTLDDYYRCYVYPT